MQTDHGFKINGMYYTSPFLFLHKPQMLDIFYKLKCEEIIPYCHSCVIKEKEQCGTCYSCEERAWGFEMLGKVDPSALDGLATADAGNNIFFVLIFSKEKVNNKIVMNDITITLKMPNIYHYTKLLVDNDDLINATFDVIADCIDTIYSDEEAFQNTPELKNDVIEFLNNLPADQFEKLEDFFSTMPLLYKEFKFQCNECSHNNELRIDSISSFF
jgi:hypothetical protein